MMGAVFKWLPQPQFFMKSKNFNAHQIEKYQEIILGSEIYSKAHFQPELWTIKVKTRGLFSQAVSVIFDLMVMKTWIKLLKIIAVLYNIESGQTRLTYSGNCNIKVFVQFCSLGCLPAGSSSMKQNFNWTLILLAGILLPVFQAKCLLLFPD